MQPVIASEALGLRTFAASDGHLGPDVRSNINKPRTDANQARRSDGPSKGGETEQTSLDPNT
eukprot:10953013-Heterocapsa_arctica.AAC.1